MGLFILKDHESELLQMNFEQILNFITEKPKTMLTEKNVDYKKEELIYHLLKKSSKGMHDLTYLLQRLEQEFKDSQEAALLGNVSSNPQLRRKSDNSQ